LPPLKIDALHILSASFVAFVDDAGFFPGTASQGLSRMRKIVCYLTAKVQIKSTEKDKLAGYFLWHFQVCGLWKPKEHKVYEEYRAVSGVSKILTPHPPLHPTSVSSPSTKGGGTHSPGGKGDQYFGRRQTLDWPRTV